MAPPRHQGGISTMLVPRTPLSGNLFGSHHYASNASSGASRRPKCGAMLFRAVKAGRLKVEV